MFNDQVFFLCPNILSANRQILNTVISFNFAGMNFRVNPILDMCFFKKLRKTHAKKRVHSSLTTLSLSLVNTTR